MSPRLDLHMSEAEVRSFLDEQRVLDMASFNPNGTVHLVAMWYAIVDGKVSLLGFASSKKTRNVSRDGRGPCLVQAGERFEELRGVSIVGVASPTRDAAQVLRVAEAMSERYDGLWPTISPTLAKRVAISVEPTEIVSWDHRRTGSL